MVPLGNIQMFLQEHDGFPGIEGRTSDILFEAGKRADEKGMVPWSRFINLLGEKGKELADLFLNEVNNSARHKEILLESWRKK